MGEVACRSITEVSSLAGLDAQTILVHILAVEADKILKTGGPYRHCFSKDPVSDGFFIDSMPTLPTLNAAGILPVKVLTIEGAALVSTGSD